MSSSQAERSERMTCPKCGSSNVVNAPDEAPRATWDWKKCFACGKRWDQSGRMLKQLNDGREADHQRASHFPPAGGDEEEQEVDHPVKASGEDLVALVMQGARARSNQSSDITEKERAMGKWSPEARERHRQVMKDLHARKREGGGTAAKSQARPVAVRRGRPLKNAVVIREPEATVVKAVGGLDLNGNAYQILGAAIDQLEHDRVALERARDVLGRMA